MAHDLSTFSFMLSDFTMSCTGHIAATMDPIPAISSFNTALAQVSKPTVDQCL